MLLSSTSRQLRHVGRCVVAHRSFATVSRQVVAKASSSNWQLAAGGAAVLSMTAATLSMNKTSLDGPAPIEEPATGIL